MRPIASVLSPSVGTLSCVIFARDYTTTKNANSTKEKKLYVEIFFFESNNPFFVAFVRFVVKSINALIHETLR